MDTITATGNHPFWVEAGEDLASRPLALEHAGEDDGRYVSATGGRWIEAGHLALGDQLLSQYSESVTVIGLQVRTERLRVYNLTVLRLRNYAVGSAGLAVHNNNPCASGTSKFVSLTIEGVVTVQVTSWAPKGVAPTLARTGRRWIMRGGPTTSNYIRTFLWGPKITWVPNGPFFPVKIAGGLKNQPINNYISTYVKKTSVKWPAGWDKWRGLFGQREFVK